MIIVQLNILGSCCVSDVMIIVSRIVMLIKLVVRPLEVSQVLLVRIHYAELTSSITSSQLHSKFSHQSDFRWHCCADVFLGELHTL